VPTNNYENPFMGRTPIIIITKAQNSYAPLPGISNNHLHILTSNHPHFHLCCFKVYFVTRTKDTSTIFGDT